MKKALAALLGSALFAVALIPVGHYPIASAAQPSPVPTYCAPPITIVAGHEAKAAEIQSDLQHAEQCSGQYGDIYTDGVFYNSTASFSGSSLSVTFPQNVVVVVGQRVYVAQSTQTVPANATSYWFLDAATGAWSSSLTNTPPSATAELQYTVVANSSGVTSVSYGISQSSTPAYASLILSGSATASDLTATNQSGHSGFMATFDNNGKLIATATPTPASLSCPTAGTNITVTGTYPCTVNSTAVGGVSSLIAGQNITLTPSGGTGNVTVAETVTPGPQATPSPTATGCGVWSGSWPYTNDTTACAGLNYANEFKQGVTMDASPNPPQVIASPTASPAGCPGNAAYPTPGPQAAFCVGSPTNTVAIAIGKVSGGWSVGTGVSANSGGLCFYKNSGTTDSADCMGFGNSGTFNMNSATFGGGGASTISTNNTNFTTGTGNGTTGKSFMGASCALSAAGSMPLGSHACKLTFTGITSMVVTFNTGTAYATQAICFAQDETTTNGAKVTACSTTSATVTATASDVVDFMVTGI